MRLWAKLTLDKGIMHIDLTNQVVLITGGSSGIGAACVRIFQEAGARVYFTYRSQPEQAARIAEQTSTTALACDITDAAACQRAVESVISAAGRLDILLNCAGVHLNAAADAEDFLKVWQQVIDVDLNGAAYCIHAAVPSMKRQGSGKIINISSVFSAISSAQNAAYSAAKAGVDGLTRACAIELASSNIQVNTVAPGPTKTPMWGIDAHYAFDAVAQFVPARRLGEPEDIAYAALFLSSPQAGYITGQTLFVDGGLTLNAFRE